MPGDPTQPSGNDGSESKPMPHIFDRYREIIPEFSIFQEFLYRPIPTHIRINRLKKRPAVVIRSLVEKGVRLEGSCRTDDTFFFAPHLEGPGRLLEYFLGYIHPQALTSCLASLALLPDRDSFVLDMCAAPGGKTAHLAQIMGNSGMIIANELYAKRHTALGHTLDRLGVMNAVVTGYQAQQFPLKHRFDFILADVPCSGEGTFRKTNKSSAFMDKPAKRNLLELQKRIILRGFDLLGRDGKMLYATCTYNPEENEAVVDFLLKERDALLLPIDVGIHHEPGIRAWRGDYYDSQLEKTARFYPHRVDSVGFFMARIGKRR